MSLDELSEFARPALEALRQPLEDGRVAVVRANHSAVYPARFMLVAATNPCPCGYAGDAERCRCSESDMARHRRRLSGPLLDRLDVVTHLERDGADDLHATPLTSSERARELVTAARERQAARLRDEAGLTVLLVEQNARSALGIADQGIVLNLGKVVVAADAAELAADVGLRKHYLGF